MKRLVILTLVALQLQFAQPGAIAAAQPVSGTKVSMEKPSGFIDAPNFSGFALPEQSASVMVTEVPTPYKPTTAGFDEAHLTPRGMQLISKEALPCGAFEGILVQISQSAAGKTFRKWIRAFGDENRTVIITATYPEESLSTLAEPLKKSVTSATYNSAAPTPSMTEDLPFTINGTKQLKLTTRIQNSLLFTSSGKLKPGGNPEDSLFIVGQAISDVDVGDTAAFARRRLKQTPQLSDMEIEKEDDVQISGLKGRRITATATDKKLGKKVFVNQTMLFGLGSYFIMQGIAPIENRKAFETEFQTIAESFKLK